MSRDVAVVVLAGGEGRRMGGGKPLRPWGATTLVSHAVALARGWAPTVAVAVRSAEQTAAAVDVPLILDDPAIAGPAAGLQSAFRFAESRATRRVLTIPCDMPRLPGDLLSRLQARLTAGDLVAVCASSGVLHPVCALWRTEAAARLPAYLGSGRTSLRGFAIECGMTVVAWETDADDPFAGANTPQELAALQPRG